MAKIRPHPAALEDQLWAFAYHVGGTIAAGGHPWHGTWYGHVYDTMSVDSHCLLPQPDLPTAIYVARCLPALPAILRDSCGLCWDYDYYHIFTPNLPRFNIYRGQSGERIIPCFFWDPWSVDPPPGFQWDGS